MGFIYSSLNRDAGENRLQYDNRIARMIPFAAGAVYFDLRNYDVQTGEFGIYIEWDKDLEMVLGYPLPAGGYFVKSTIAQAYRFHALDRGLPIYVKLISQNGHLYLYRTYVMMEGRPFSVEFGGGVLIPFEDRYEELGCEAAVECKTDGGSQRFRWNGSQMRQLFGSQGGLRYLSGSQYRTAGSQRFRWNGSQMRQLFGSQGGFRYLSDSQYRMAGSQRFRWNGSQMRQLFGSQGGFRYLSGSQYRTTGSQRFRWNGSQMRQLFGSQGGFRHLSGSQGMCRRADAGICTQQIPDCGDSVRVSQELLARFPQEWQLINRSRRPASRIGGNAKFGYGLDLI